MDKYNKFYEYFQLAASGKLAYEKKYSKKEKELIKNLFKEELKLYLNKMLMNY